MSGSEDASYNEVLQKLSTFPPPLLPPGKSYDANLTARIASLQAHPTIEAALHILNHDLPSAHFLVRHMQSPPAVEGMLLHAIVHRIEGDYDNSRAWYSDVGGDEKGGELLDVAWKSTGGGGKSSALEFVDGVEGLQKRKQGDKARLTQRSGEEIMAVLKWCEEKFGTERWVDASSAWVKPSEKIQEMGQKMTTGGEGFRDF